jgi:hypothetical protein
MTTLRHVREMLLGGLLLATPAMAIELDSTSTGADYIQASEGEQEAYAFFIATRLNKTRNDMEVDGQAIDGCLRGMLIEVEEGQEAAHVQLAHRRLHELAEQCAVTVNQPPRKQLGRPEGRS